MLLNTSTPRIFVAATRQNDGKTTTSLGLLSALQKYYPRISYIKPVGQRFVEIDSQKIDEDSVLMDRVFHLNGPLIDMSPIAVEPDFTRKYLSAANNEHLVNTIQGALDRVAWEKDFILCEGTGHAGVGSVFDLSNAQVAKALQAKVIIVTQGGIGRPIDEVALNQALFEKEGVEIMGVILNKVILEKIDYITEFARKGLKRKGLELLGVIPHQRILSSPTVALIQEGLKADLLSSKKSLNNLVDHVIIGAMSAKNACKFLKPSTLLILPGDREDLIGGPSHPHLADFESNLAGMILTDNLKPTRSLLSWIKSLPFPVLFSQHDCYHVASVVHDLIVKTRPDDTIKIALIRDLIREHVNVKKIIQALQK